METFIPLVRSWTARSNTYGISINTTPVYTPGILCWSTWPPFLFIGILWPTQCLRLCSHWSRLLGSLFIPIKDQLPFARPSYLIPRHINVYYLYESWNTVTKHTTIICECHNTMWVFKHHNVNRDTPIIFGALFYAGIICEYPPTDRDVTNDLLSFIWLWDIHCVSTGRIICLSKLRGIILPASIPLSSVSVIIPWRSI